MKWQKQKWICLIYIIILICTGCSSGTSSWKNIEESLEPTNQENMLFSIPEQKETDLASLFFLGYGKEEKEKNLSTFLEKYHWSMDTIEEVREQEDGEWYLILPKCAQTEISIERVKLNDNGELEVVDTLANTDKSILLCCNCSDIVPSTKVTITYGEEKTDFSPSISLQDGSVNQADRVYTATID